jgi:hypothetical protein
VPLDLLSSDQDRIARRLAFLDAQINAGDIEYDQAKAHPDVQTLAVRQQGRTAESGTKPVMSAV